MPRPRVVTREAESGNRAGEYVNGQGVSMFLRRAFQPPCSPDMNPSGMSSTDPKPAPAKKEGRDEPCP
jgi:hypothetical protein